MSNKVVTILSETLADSYALYLKTQNYHWNVEGPEFHSIHEMLEMQYTDLSEAIDEIAEIIRTFNHKVAGSFYVFQKMTNIKDGNENLPAKSMLEELVKDNEYLIEKLANAVSVSQKEGEEAVAGALTGRLSAHKKQTWMLKSMLK